MCPAGVGRGNFDGNSNMGEIGIRKQLEAVRDAAGVSWFHLNGWLHTAIARMAEAGIPIAIIMERAGHCSPKMTAHYTHISTQAQRMAMQSMSYGRPFTPPRSSERPPQAPAINMMDPAILAEIDRQVERQLALALHKEREERHFASAVTKQSCGPRLVMFPGKGSRPLRRGNDPRAMQNETRGTDGARLRPLDD